jgi:hypothetical protein
MESDVSAVAAAVGSDEANASGTVLDGYNATGGEEFIWEIDYTKIFVIGYERSKKCWP